MFDVNTDCPYLSADCCELGCAYCDIAAELAGEDEDEDDEDLN